MMEKVIRRPTNKLAELLTIFIITSSLTLAFFTIYTNIIWDDFFITFRYSKNFVEGNGAVYNLGERVYGFTSPLEFLLLAFCYLATGKISYFYAIWLFRIISAAAFVGGGLLLLTLCYKDKKQIPASIALAIGYILETKSVVFSISGMETAFMLFFISCLIFIFYQDFPKHWFVAGLSCAGLMWTRPDSFIYLVSLYIANIIFNRYPRKEMLVAILKVSCICAVFYLPWFIWTWIYYGCPVPHTILAKLHLEREMTVLSVYQCIFGPIYLKLGPGPGWIKLFSYSLGFFSSFYWIIPQKDRFVRMLSFTFFLLYLYFLSIPTAFPWYSPPVAVIGLFVFVRGTFALFEFKIRNRLLNILVIVTLSLAGMAMSYIFAITTIEMRIRQKEVEQNRIRLGLWLKDNIRRGESVYLEPLGYLGYFSEARMLDYPGLVSSEVERILRGDKKSDFYTLVPQIKPDWIVLRPWEAKRMLPLDYFRNNYTYVKIFTARETLKKYRFIPRPIYMLYDATFLIFRKNISI